ncbi:hypothetical protein AB0892_08625 [Streptomyces sp. NPDC005409]|uniref:hypothetical protein n=1 Tax=Streptomyces sp. NPDC005409 TaxID=3155342 RepID=UPI0034523A1C
MSIRTAVITAVALLALTACTAGGGTQAAKPTPSPTATLSPTVVVSPTPVTISPACRSKVSDLLLENISGAPVPSERPTQCHGLTDQQWSEVIDEQGKKLVDVGGAIAGSQATEPAVTEVVFKVWGKASAGTSITYGSDSQNLDGKGLPMTETLQVKDDALYYHITAQLQGGGDIHCSVTLGSETKEGQARGGYNICSAQINLL